MSNKIIKFKYVGVNGSFAHIKKKKKDYGCFVGHPAYFDNLNTLISNEQFNV